MDIDYIVKLEGNEEVTDRFVKAIIDGSCGKHKKSPYPLMLSTGEKILPKVPLWRYLDGLKPFNYAKAVEYAEKVRKITGFYEISYYLDLWIKDQMYAYYKVNKVFHFFLRDDRPPEPPDEELLKFICYAAVANLKFGPSYASVRADRYFEVVKEMGSGEPARLKKHGTGTLPPEITSYKDDNLICKANDAFGEISINIKNETEDAYKKALEFINALLAVDFPKSYKINFKSKDKAFLPVKGLPKKSVNTFFAGVMRYPSLYGLAEQYANLAMTTHEWYTDLDNEQCAMPGTFAVLMLVMQDKKYFPLFEKYLRLVDEEHQEIHTKITPLFLQKYGMDSETLPLFILLVFSCQSHKHDKLYAELFSNDENAAALERYRGKLKVFLDTDIEDDEDIDDEGFEDYLWDGLQYTIWGKKRKPK